MMQLTVSMMAKKEGSSSSVKKMTTRSTTMPMMVGSSPLLMINLTTVMTRFSSIQMASTMNENPVERNSSDSPKKRSKSDEPMGMRIITSSSSASVTACESKASTKKSPLASLLSRRAVAMPNV